MAFFNIDANQRFPNPPTPQPISAGAIYEATSRYVVPAGVANGATVQMVPLPARSRVVGVTAAAVGQATTIQVGDALDTDRYITNGAVAAGAVTRTNAATAFGFTNLSATTLDIVFGATPTAGGTIFVTVFYVIE